MFYANADYTTDRPNADARALNAWRAEWGLYLGRLAEAEAADEAAYAAQYIVSRATYTAPVNIKAVAIAALSSIAALTFVIAYVVAL